MTHANTDDVVTGQPDTWSQTTDTEPTRLDDTRPLDLPLYVGPIENPDEYQLVGVPEGSGGQGQVWKGQYLSGRLRVEVAVKILLAPASSSPDWPSEIEVARWRDEVNLLSRVQHRHVVRYHKLIAGWEPHEAGTRRGEPARQELRWYVLTEFIEGRALSALVREGQVELGHSVAHIKELALAVNHLHTQVPGGALLHCDIKPSNARVSPTRGLVLVDFGLVELEGPHLGVQRVGSRPYMAPEVLEGEPPSIESDKWSVAATAFYAFTGETPDPRRLAWMQGRLRAQVAPALADRVAAMLASKAQRQHMDLVSWANSLPVPYDIVGAPRRSRRRAFALSVAALTLVGGAFALGRAGSGGGHTDAGTNPQTRVNQSPAGGPAVAELPPAGDYIGRPIDQVRSELETLGVAVQVVEREVVDRQPAVVIDQSVPPAGTLARGLTLTVAKAPRLVPIEEIVLTVDGKNEDAGIFGNSWNKGPISIGGQSSTNGHFIAQKYIFNEPLKEYNANFVLSRKYRRFIVRAGVLDNAANEGPFRVRVTGDTSDRILLEQNVRLDEPLDLNLDVSELSRITVTFLVPKLPGGLSVGVAEAKGIPIS